MKLHATKQIFIVMIIFFISRIDLKAQNSNNDVNINIAVASFSANNVSDSYARALQDMVVGKLFENDIFSLLEKSTMDEILKSHGISINVCQSEKCLAKLGKLLKVEKIVVGSISKLDDYRIELRVVDVRRGKIELSFAEECDDTGEFEYIVEQMINRARNYYLGFSLITGKFDLGFRYTNVLPLGDLKKGVKLGYGAELNLYFNKPFGSLHSSLLLSLGYLSFQTKVDYLKSYRIFPIELFYQYNYEISENFILSPSFGGGYLITRVEDDIYKYRAANNYEYRIRYTYNPVISLRLDISLLVYGRIYATFTPRYSLFFEKARRGYLAGGNVGFKILF